MKDATIIAIDLKKILTLGNSVSWGNLLMFAVAEIINICRKALYPFMERADICLA